MKTMKLILPLLLALCGQSFLAAQYKGATPPPAVMLDGFDNIKQQDCKTWLTYLSSDELGGRKTGSQGHRMAAKYMADRFKEFGLKPIGDKGTYFQEVTLYRISGGPQTGHVTIGNKTWDENSGLRMRSTFGHAKAGVVFISSGSKKKGLKDPTILKDKILVLNLSRSVALSPLFAQIMNNRPAAMILLGRTPSPLRSRGSLKQEWHVTIPQVAANDATFASILKALKIKKSFAKKPQKNAFKVILTKIEVEIATETPHETIKAPNVIGMLEGTDKYLKHEVVICGSHLDHIGTNANGQINNGADDDGSGSTSLLAVARAFCQSPNKTRRSLVFIAVCGEEDGLLGSEYYVENPIIPIKDTICELQMDMVGRNEEGRGDRPEDNIKTTHLVGSKKLSTDLHKLIIKMNKHVGFKFEYDQESVYYRSDHYNFAKKGIPIAFFFSGFHPDYHKPTDTIEKINFEKLANTAKLVFLTAFSAADRSKRIVVDKKKRKAL